MGTNFYLKKKYSTYKQHIAKTSAGWLPLFEASENIHSVADIKVLYDTKKYFIIDEYDKKYNWEQFDKRVLKHNGGVVGAIPREYYDKNPSSIFYDPNMPGWIPVSHFDTQYAYMYFKDIEGYEFTEGEFS